MASDPRMTHHLSTQEAISDTIHRFAYGLDDADADAIASCFVSDAVLDFPWSGKTSGCDAIVALMMDTVGKVDTMHMVTNVSTKILDDGSSAHATAYALAEHWKTGEGRGLEFSGDLLGGNRYEVDLVKDGKGWKIKYFKIKAKWIKGDPSVFSR